MDVRILLVRRQTAEAQQFAHAAHQQARLARGRSENIVSRTRQLWDSSQSAVVTATERAQRRAAGR